MCVCVGGGVIRVLLEFEGDNTTGEMAVKGGVLLVRNGGAWRRAAVAEVVVRVLGGRLQKLTSATVMAELCPPTFMLKL